MNSGWTIWTGPKISIFDSCFLDLRLHGGARFGASGLAQVGRKAAVPERGSGVKLLNGALDGGPNPGGRGAAGRRARVDRPDRIEALDDIGREQRRAVAQAVE